MPHETDKSLFWMNIARPCAFLTYQVTRFVLVAVFSFPVALIYVVSAVLLDPSIPVTSKYRLPQLLIDRFDQVFHYSVTLAILLSLGVSCLLLLKGALERLNLSGIGSTLPGKTVEALKRSRGSSRGHWASQTDSGNKS